MIQINNDIVQAIILVQFIIMLIVGIWFALFYFYGKLAEFESRGETEIDEEDIFDERIG